MDPSYPNPAQTGTWLPDQSPSQQQQQQQQQEQQHQPSPRDQDPQRAQDPEHRQPSPLHPYPPQQPAPGPYHQSPTSAQPQPNGQQWHPPPLPPPYSIPPPHQPQHQQYPQHHLHQQVHPSGPIPPNYPSLPPNPSQPNPQMAPQHVDQQYRQHPIPMPGPHMYAPMGPMQPGMVYEPQQSAPRQRTAIACSYCRRRKIRCSGFDQAEDGKCANCQRSKQVCVFTPVASQSSVFVPAHTVWRAQGGPPPQLYGAYGQPIHPGVAFAPHPDGSQSYPMSNGQYHPMPLPPHMQHPPPYGSVQGQPEPQPPSTSQTQPQPTPQQQPETLPQQARDSPLAGQKRPHEEPHHRTVAPSNPAPTSQMANAGGSRLKQDEPQPDPDPEHIEQDAEAEVKQQIQDALREDHAPIIESQSASDAVGRTLPEQASNQKAQEVQVVDSAEPEANPAPIANMGAGSTANVTQEVNEKDGEKVTRPEKVVSPTVKEAVPLENEPPRPGTDAEVDGPARTAVDAQEDGQS